jgi:flagellar basal body-associated protein FliL
MSKADDSAALANSGRGRAGLFASWKLIAIVLPVIAIAAGAGGYFFLIERSNPGNEKTPINELPLPSYVTIKPFVVTMTNTAGTPHFVQLGADLNLSDPAAGNMVTAVLPEVQDAFRQTLLRFQVDEIVTAAGVDKMRAALLASVNQVLLQRLGAERVKRLSGGDATGGVVRNIYFSTLIVE